MEKREIRTHTVTSKGGRRPSFSCESIEEYASLRGRIYSS